jgi:hypothetical protein
MMHSGQLVACLPQKFPAAAAAAARQVPWLPLPAILATYAQPCRCCTVNVLYVVRHRVMMTTVAERQTPVVGAFRPAEQPAAPPSLTAAKAVEQIKV